MKAKLTLVFMLLILCLCGFASAEEATIVHSGTYGDNLTWTLDSEGTLTISGEGAMDDFANLEPGDAEVPYHSYRASIKAAVIESGVTTIGKAAFYDCVNMTEVSIPESVTIIGNYAFVGCTSLSDVRLPSALTTIGFRAFSECERLTRISLPETLTHIKDYAFEYCAALAEITIPGGVQVGQRAFSTCIGLKSVTFPDGGVHFDYYCFDGCVGLTAVYADSIEEWLSVYFGDNYCNPLYYAQNLYIGGELLTELTIPDGYTSVSGYAFSNYGKLTSVYLPNSVTSIGGGAFSGCKELKSINIPARISEIEVSTFSHCSSLTSIVIPKSVKSIGAIAFKGCTGLKSISLPGGLTYLGDGAFEMCTSLAAIAIPNGVTAIESSTFSRCYNLSDVSLPDGINAIGHSAFYGCKSLNSIDIPESCTMIDSYAFQLCTGLTGVIVPKNVTTIDAGAFASCTELLSVVITGDNTSIYGTAFSACKGIKYLIFTSKHANVPNDDAFPWLPNATLYCHKGSGIDTWGEFDFGAIEYIDGKDPHAVWGVALPAKCILEPGDTVRLAAEVVPAHVATSLTWQSSAPGVVSVENGKITAHRLGAATITVTTGNGLTASCNATVHHVFTLPDELVTIEAGAFANIDATMVILREKCTDVGSRAFAGNPQLLYIYMPDSVKSIADDAFEGSPNVCFICETDNTAMEYAKARGIPCETE